MTYEEENSELLEYILKTKFYDDFSRNEKRPDDSTLELYITSTCNQRCEYCYLVKHGDAIYPEEIRDEGLILKNLHMLIDYYLQKGYHPKRIDLFSGEIWGTAFGDKILEAILEGIDKGWNIPYIMIPSNMSYILDDTRVQKIERYIARFKEKKCRLAFSASVDGQIIENSTRPFADSEKNKQKNSADFYKTLFDFCKRHRYAFHPMVSAFSIENWKSNYEWWQQMFQDYKLDPFEYGMYLEVRNNEWSIEKIESYLDFLNYMIDYDYSHYMGSSLKILAENVLIIGANKKGYFPYVILNEGNTYPCTVDKNLMVRLGDLAIGPCHRTSYEKFIYGRYVTEDGKIKGLKANNVQLANMILLGTIKSLSRCCNCPIARFCLRGCLGAQYEANKEITMPCDTVCQLFKAKLIFLNMKYESMGLYRYVSENHEFQRSSMAKAYRKASEKLRKEEPNLWNYWTMKITEMLH